MHEREHYHSALLSLGLNLYLHIRSSAVLYYCFNIIKGIVSGDSANAVPPTKKLRTRVTRIWGDRSRQPNLSAMEGPRAEPTA